ncbi:MAG: hypothetical protein Q9219_004622 [cf. Caloplaca sp. 3 TL-2023]
MDKEAAMKISSCPPPWAPPSSVEEPFELYPSPANAQASPLRKKVFPFLKLSAELRNQIYLDIIGPSIPRPSREEQHPQYSWLKLTIEATFWPDRQFNAAFFVLNRQIYQEFAHTLWKVLNLEWRIKTFDLNPKELALFTSMKRLQRCTLIFDSTPFLSPELLSRPTFKTRYGNATAHELDIELTIFGLAHKLNRMSCLDEIHLEYGEESNCNEDYFVRYRDGSLLRLQGSDLRTVFGNELRGMKKVKISGTLCDECSALFASAMERPKEVLSEFYLVEPEKCIPRASLPQWDDKVRRWV